MNKFGIIAAVLTVLIIGGGIVLMSKPQKPVAGPEAGVYEYFWGDGCPHCENVDQFVKTWEKKDSVNIKKMEVWFNKENAEIIVDRASKCGIAKDSVAVPFLYTPDGKCIVGDVEIIELYKTL